ncbi:MAG: DNA repair protein RecO [Bacteroidales bacterium]|nr:DNA repair protein RecO [Bacteroidales bacterium]MCF8332512.1 DNA repair protein RecO [Bacteroidales bacterium]
MLHKTKGIFFQKINYSESSLIVRIYTRKFGLQSYLLKGARKKRSRMQSNVLQHLVLLDMEVYHRENANLQKIKEFGISRHFVEIPYSIRKSAIAMFLNEVLIKSIKEEEANTSLFEFLENALVFLDNTQEKVTNFHLIFLLQLTRFLGFYPHNNFSRQTPYFDMSEGRFISSMRHPQVMDESKSLWLSRLMKGSLENMDQLQLPHEQHTGLMKKILDYYTLHLPGFSKVKSMEVLQAVFL